MTSQTVSNSLTYLGGSHIYGAGSWGSTNRMNTPGFITRVSNSLYPSALGKTDITNFYEAFGFSEAVPIVFKSWFPGKNPGFFSDIYELPVWVIPDAYSTWTSNSNAIDAAEDDAAKKLLNKLKSATASYQALIPLGELRETANLYKSLCNVTIQALQGIASLKRRGPRRYLRDFSELWLNYSFGVSPLIADISAGLDAASSRLAGMQDSPLYIDSSGIRITSHRYGPYIMDSQLGGQYVYTVEQERVTKVRYTSAYLAKVENAVDYSAAQQFNITLGGIPSALYELTALSWVLDYFTNVGGVLEDTFYVPPVSKIYLCRSASVEYNHLMKGDVRPLLQPWRFDGLSNGRMTAKHYIRNAVSMQVPSRILRVKFADEVARNATSRVLNLASVLVAQRKLHP